MADGTFNIALGREVGFALNVNNNTPVVASSFSEHRNGGKG